MSENDEIISLFEKLKKIRLDKNISLKTISRDSRIQLAYLEAIEAGQFDKIPTVYDKLFFQTYISYLNLDNPEQYQEEFKLLRKESSSTSPTTTLRRITTSDVKNHPIYNLKTLFIAAPAILIVFIIGFMAFNTENIGEDPDEKVIELPVRKIVQEYNEIEKAKEDSLKIENLADVKKMSVEVKIAASEKTWLRYIKDKSDTTEYMLHSGNIVTIKADSTLHFLVGNAAGVKFTINGEQKGILGKPGEVISYLKVTGKGIVGQRIKQINEKN